MITNDYRVKIGEIPFVFSPIDSPNNPQGIPNKLPFSLELIDGVISQSRNDLTEKALEDAYRIGSTMTGQMDDWGNGKEYADDFLSFILNSVGDVSNKKILEIGCGTGFLLSCLQKLGAEVIGVEPGDSADYGKNKWGLNIIKDFFDKEAFKEKFDLVIFYGVLEHMSNIPSFLNDVKAVLADRGGVLLGVPNCTKHVLNGDISMLFCEHYSYFTENSFKYCLHRNGLDGYFSQSASGGTLYAYVHFNWAGTIKNACELEDVYEYSRFVKNYNLNKRTISDFLKSSLYDGLAIYVPGRFVYWLSVLCNDISICNIRFIDDNELIVGTYYPGFPQKIESLFDYMSNPGSNILISSYSYKDSIMHKLAEVGYKGNVFCIGDLLA